jgi:flavin-dependent dehydrogenase
MEPEIVIIGGGPAGAYCATELAKNGIYALIIDHSHPREKPCGGGISTKVLKKFPFVEQFSLKGRKTYALRLISHPPENKEIFGTNTQQRRLLISRKYLDEQLLNMAIQHGAKLIKEKVNDIQKEHNRWKILTNKGSLYAKIIVGADGVNSIVRRKTIGKPIPPEDLALTFGYYAVGIENKPPTIKYLGRIPEIGKEYLLGYIWVFPRLENSSIGIGGELRYGSKLKRVLDDFVLSRSQNIIDLCLFTSISNKSRFL